MQTRILDSTTPMYRCMKASKSNQPMPEDRKDTQPAAQRISEAADQLAAVALAAENGADPGTSETQQDVDQLLDTLSDPELWKPHPPTEDCPVCLVPLPLEDKNATYFPCCGKVICTACCKEHSRALEITNRKRGKKELPPLEAFCAFCRELINRNEVEHVGQLKKRVDKGDVVATFSMAFWYRDGLEGFPKDEAKALELLKKGR